MVVLPHAQPAKPHTRHLSTPHAAVKNVAIIRSPEPAASKQATVDRLLAGVLFVFAAPVILILALLVKLTSRGPAFYSQSRVGLDGKVFPIYKLRSMSHNCEAASGVRWAAARDPRVTTLGRILRVTHLDELPQLWNVIRGDMSLVGPRPERPEFVTVLEQEIPRYTERLQVRPGVTGLAQVQLPADTDLDSVRRKLVFDLYYIRHQNLWLDLRLMTATAFKMLHVPSNVSVWVLRIPAVDTVKPCRASFDHSMISSSVVSS